MVIILYVEFLDVKYFFEEVKMVFLMNYMFIVLDSWVGFIEVI